MLVTLKKERVCIKFQICFHKVLNYSYNLNHIIIQYCLRWAERNDKWLWVLQWTSNIGWNMWYEESGHVCTIAQHSRWSLHRNQHRRGNNQRLWRWKNTLIKHAAGLWRDYIHVHTHTHTHNVFLTCRSGWKTPVFVLEPLLLPCLQGNVMQSKKWTELTRLTEWV